MNSVAQIIDWYGVDSLFPVSGKDPDRKWKDKVYTKLALVKFVKKGYNLAFRVPPGMLVIDIDPRNGGFESLPKMLGYIGIKNLAEVYPTIKTGGGGWHHYITVPDGFKAANELKGLWPGIEFKGHGKYVVAAGSTHPLTGELYTLVDGCPLNPSPPPGKLLDAIKRRSTSVQNLPGGALSANQLHDILSQMPVEDFRSNDEWLEFACACHHATNGTAEAGQVFLDWSASDPQYHGYEDVNLARWDSLNVDGGVTDQTLFAKMRKYGIVAESAEVTAELTDSLPPLPPLPEPPVETVTVQPEKVVGLPAETKTVKSEKTKPVHPEEKSEKSEKKTKETEENAVVNIAEGIYKREFKSTYLIHAINQEFWRYDGVVWRLMLENEMWKLAFNKTRAYCSLRNASPSTYDTLVKRVINVLKALSMEHIDMYGYLVNPIINTKNCELHLQPETGLYEIKPHHHSSYQIQHLNIHFDTSLDCPLFIQTLDEIFYFNDDKDEIISHLFEVFGYVIQPVKNIPIWAYFMGDGANGKSLVLDVLSALLGDKGLSTAIDSLDPKTNAHALENVPGKLAIIDRDISAKTLLPDSLMKKLSENTMMTANPKYKRPYDFLNTATLLFAGNSHPKTSDLSHGMRRRAIVFDFNRIFSIDEQDLTRGRRIIGTELAGVLNRCLQGLQRLRQRGRFAPPASCRRARDSWLLGSNSIHTFVSESLEAIRGEYVKLSSVWSSYQIWCTGENTKNKMTRTGFVTALSSLGITVSRDNKNVQQLSGYRLKPNLD